MLMVGVLLRRRERVRGRRGVEDIVIAREGRGRGARAVLACCFGRPVLLLLGPKIFLPGGSVINRELLCPGLLTLGAVFKAPIPSILGMRR
jgi:hypothetical protein